MSSCARQRGRNRTWLIASMLLVLCGLGGCTNRATPETAKTDAGAGSTGQPGTLSAPSSDIALDPRLHQSFSDATIAEPPADWHRPPDITTTGKSIGKLYTEVISHWDEIKFTSAGGKPLGYRATLQTELGPIVIALRPDLAPNHVRSFIALARAGYYDGLVFDRTIHEDVVGKPDAHRELIEGGCPLGTGEPGYGSIGYWLKPEFSPDASHEEGTVGASHGEEEDTAACKFYITLCKSPFMDGNYTVFGQVTRGLDVARKILSLPVRNDPEFPDGDRPLRPVVIQKVTIESFEAAMASTK